MRLAVVKRTKKRRPLTRRDWASDRRRGGPRRVWIGRRPRASASRPVFFALNAQHMERLRPADLAGAAAMLLGVVSWGMLAALLGG